jgi:hypothetical protein
MTDQTANPWDVYDEYEGDKSALAQTAYPWIQWHNGKKESFGFAMIGGPFVPSDQVPSGVKIAGEEMSLATSDEDVLGYGFTMLKIAYLAQRLDWQAIEQANPVRLGRATPSYDEAKATTVAGQKPRGRTRVVCLVGEAYLPEFSKSNPREMIGGKWVQFATTEDGAPFWGPWMLTIRSTNGKALGIAIKDAKSIYFNAVEKARGKPMPDYGLWIPLKVGPITKPNPSMPSTTTPPALLRPSGDALELARQLVPPKEVLDLAHAEWGPAQEWAVAKLTGEFGEPDVPSVDERGGSHGEAPFRNGQRPVDTSDPDF